MDVDSESDSEVQLPSEQWDESDLELPSDFEDVFCACSLSSLLEKGPTEHRNKFDSFPTPFTTELPKSPQISFETRHQISRERESAPDQPPQAANIIAARGG